MATCRLCGEERELLASHVLPAFIFRWFKATSATGHIRLSGRPNLRLQDGERRRWFCAACEQRIGTWEARFATDIFHPYLEDSRARLPYADWMLKFCVSVSWRSLMRLNDDGLVENILRTWPDAVEQALGTWREFLLGCRPDPDTLEQHIIPLDQLASFDSKLPTNMNRYLMRAIDVDAVRGPEIAFVFTKFGRFVLFGFVAGNPAGEWAGARVDIGDGTIEPRNYSLPGQMLEYLRSRAEHSAAAKHRMSDRQKSKVAAAIRSDMERLAKSDTFRAMQADVEMFGKDAVFKKRED